MDNNDHLCFYGVDRKTGRVAEIALMRGWKKVYRTPKKWTWQPDGNWNEQQVQGMRDQGLAVRVGCAADVRVGMDYRVIQQAGTVRR